MRTVESALSQKATTDASDDNLCPASESAADSQQLLHDLLAKDRGTQAATTLLKPTEPVHGVVVGRIIGMNANGQISLQIPVLGIDVEARVACIPESLAEAEEAAVMFEQGDIDRPLVIGAMHHAPQVQAQEVIVNNERIVIEAEHELELRCGNAVILLTADGRILQRGNYISSHASATQRIRGGSVQIN